MIEGRLTAMEDRFSAMKQRFAVQEERMTAMLGLIVRIAESVERGLIAALGLVVASVFADTQATDLAS